MNKINLINRINVYIVISRCEKYRITCNPLQNFRLLYLKKLKKIYSAI